MPRPKIPENDIEPSGHNSTRPNEALFINVIPEGAGDETSWISILKKFCHQQSIPWRTASKSKVRKIINVFKRIIDNVASNLKDFSY